MITKKIITLLLLLCFTGGAATVFAQTHYVEIKCSGAVNGTMKVMLYDDCPRTTANFMQKVRDGYYDDTLWGRVIDQFMIQGGAPDSRNANPGWSLGFGDRDQEIAGEIRSHHIPKKGALAAPHRIDDKQKHSDMSMFFIVQGYQRSEKFWRNMEKTNNAQYRKTAQKKVMTQAVKDSLKTMKEAIDSLSYRGLLKQSNEVSERYNALAREVNQAVDSIARTLPGSRFFTDQEIEAYSTVGGAYHIYGEYTIYGEVVEGLELIDKIAALETNSADRPREDVRMKLRVIK